MRRRPTAACRRGPCAPGAGAGRATPPRRGRSGRRPPRRPPRAPPWTGLRACAWSCPISLQQLAPDDHPLDLGRSLADEQQRRVAVQALDLVLLRVAVAAVDAEALLDAEAPGLGGEELRHAGLELRALARVLQPRGLAREQARRLD